jgi:hypothetical protein
MTSFGQINNRVDNVVYIRDHSHRRQADRVVRKWLREEDAGVIFNNIDRAESIRNSSGG